ncbi:hypothetical protein SAMN05444004_10252 [Jannaschia faecimaris]|uniref:Uncharacterized protein n=1 Tax=Jannaschia faecimaris TaxID=1244108 RepID=A0A1H3L2F0_9RHOB|nr:hypothetical protein SAMN05444004_10252 [Jannaschia faecimaris]
MGIAPNTETVARVPLEMFRAYADLPLLLHKWWRAADSLWSVTAARAGVIRRDAPDL